MHKVYFDHSATTPVDQKVLEAMLPYFSDFFGNASSVHSFGQEAMKAIDQARNEAAKFLNCAPEEIIFTSGATEADNLAIMGIVTSNKEQVTRIKPHVMTTLFEHPAVLEVVKHLEKIGVIEASYVKPDEFGLIHVEDIEKEIKENTVLISVMYVNNEIGIVQPIKEIGKMIQEIKKLRNKEIEGNENKICPLYFHTDAVQATLFCEMDVEKLGVDLLSISGHKIYGPKGVGILYVKKGTAVKPIQYGGHHEFGLRPGTLNTPLIFGMGKALELVKTRDNKELKNLRDYLWSELQKNIPNIKLNGSLEKRAFNNLNFTVNGVEGEAMLLGLDLAGIAVSTGSACSSGSLEPSHVLMAIGLSHEKAHGSLRITLGYENTKEEVDEFIKTLKPLVEKFRNMAPKNEK